MTARNAAFERVRGYLQAQAAELTTAEIVARLRAQSALLWQAAFALPDGSLRVRPGAEEWAAAEVLTHVLDWNDRCSGMIEDIIATGAPPAPVRDELHHEQRADLATVADYEREWLERRERLYGQVCAARGDEHLDVRLEHFMFGPLNWREWLLFMRIHDKDHTGQLQQISAAPAGPRGAA